jgi:plasmid stabilization system protein ParE
LRRLPTIFESATRWPSQRVRAAVCDSLQDLILFPYIGRVQQIKGVRKFVTLKYRYLVYYTVDEAAGEIIILSSFLV